MQWDDSAHSFEQTDSAHSTKSSPLIRATAGPIPLSKSSPLIIATTTTELSNPIPGSNSADIPEPGVAAEGERSDGESVEFSDDGELAGLMDEGTHDTLDLFQAQARTAERERSPAVRLVNEDNDVLQPLPNEYQSQAGASDDGDDSDDML